jgi:hypothetical protein
MCAMGNKVLAAGRRELGASARAHWAEHSPTVGLPGFEYTGA